MSRQYFTECLAWETADGTAIANTTTETIIFPNKTIPANMMSDGRLLIIRAFGRYSTTGTPTLTFRVRWGGVSGTVLAASGAMVTGSTVTNAMWSVEVAIQTRINGSSGSLFAIGEAALGEDATSTVGSTTNARATDFMGSAGVAVPAAVTVDLTADAALSLTAQWGTASVSNTLTGHIYYLMSPN
jgi:hypothetical protein